MPFPATWHADPHVGASRDQGPSSAPRADTQVRGLLRGGARAGGHVCALHLPEIRCPDLRGVPQEVVAAPLTRQAHGGRAGQRTVPPRRLAGATATQVPTSPEAAVPAAVLTAPRPDRAGVEARKTPGDPQPVFCHTGRTARRRRSRLRPMEQTQSGTATLMLHYLRRHV